ncbi:MAG: NUDIX domain-containing protein [Blastocatellia bacterium]|nr:NUDIX domain-containing protein [Blastocatellia bacterium]
MIHKVCPFIIRQRDKQKEILVFRHPIGNNIQFVKGTVEAGENLEVAARRELLEESGIEKLSKIEFKGSRKIGTEKQIWHFFYCHPADVLPESWTFFANDDGGLNFSFFWFDIEESPSDEWHPTFQQALKFIKSKL